MGITEAIKRETADQAPDDAERADDNIREFLAALGAPEVTRSVLPLIGGQR